MEEECGGEGEVTSEVHGRWRRSVGGRRGDIRGTWEMEECGGEGEVTSEVHGRWRSVGGRRGDIRGTWEMEEECGGGEGEVTSVYLQC